MAKKALKILFAIMGVLVIGFVALVAWSFHTREDYVYGGRFYWRNLANVSYHQDTGLLNHLAVNSMDGGQDVPFDVYYRHIRDAEDDSFQEELERKRFEFDIKAIPLNVNNEPIGEGLMGGTISMHAVIAAKGVFGVEPSNFVVKDTVTGVTLYSIDGKMTPEMLNEGSAGEVIMKEYIERNGEKSDRFWGRGQDLKK